MTYEEGAEVTVAGFVRAGGFVTAPVTGSPCVVAWTRARVWDRLDLAGSLVEDVMFSNIAPFVLDTGATPIHIGQTSCVVEGWRYDLWPHPLTAAQILRTRDLERYVRSTFFTQALVYPNDYITVRGVVAHEADQGAELGYRETATLTRLVGYPGRPLTISR